MSAFADARALPVLRPSDLVRIARAAHPAVDAVHVEINRRGAVAVEPFAFYDAPVPAEALGEVRLALGREAPDWLLVEVGPAWQHVRVGGP